MSKGRTRCRTLLEVVTLILAISGCARLAGPQYPASADSGSACRTNMVQIALALHTSSSGGNFPSKLSELEASVDPSLFVCHGTGSKPGEMSKIEDWTDFVYIGNLMEGVLNVALVISPPENHGMRYGYACGVTCMLPGCPLNKCASLYRIRSQQRQVINMA
jgi:hypothetical protein